MLRRRGYSGRVRIVVMGVTGCGKTTVGSRLADAIGADFLDGDDLHPPSNVFKMAGGEALTDEDREPWLDAVGAWLAARESGVIACSALKRAYRDRLRAAADGVFFLHLAAPMSAITRRVEERSATTDHFAGSDLLASQYAALEPLQGDEDGFTIDVNKCDPAQAVAFARQVIA